MWQMFNLAAIFLVCQLIVVGLIFNAVRKRYIYTTRQSAPPIIGHECIFEKRLIVYASPKSTKFVEIGLKQRFPVILHFIPQIGSKIELCLNPIDPGSEDKNHDFMEFRTGKIIGVTWRGGGFKTICETEPLEFSTPEIILPENIKSTIKEMEQHSGWTIPDWENLRIKAFLEAMLSQS